MFWQSGASTGKWGYGSLLKEATTKRLTTPIFINRTNVLLAVEGELQVRAEFSGGHSGVVKGMNTV